MSLAVCLLGLIFSVLINQKNILILNTSVMKASITKNPRICFDTDY